MWGEQGMAALWGAATKKLIGAGVDSPRLARDVAILVGHHDVPVRSISVGDGRASEQISCQRRLILEAADIRGHRTRAPRCCWPAGIRPALLDLRPWYARPDAARIDAARLRAEAAIQRAAQAASGPTVRQAGQRLAGRPCTAGRRLVTADSALPPPAADGTSRPTRCTAASRTGSTGTSCPCTGARWAGSTGGARNGGGTPRRSPGSPRCGSRWEAMRLQPGTGMISWLRDCLDHQLPVLLGRGGPFAACSEDEHIDPRTAQADPPPPAGGTPAATIPAR